MITAKKLKLKIISFLILLIIFFSCIATSTITITDTDITFSINPLRIVRYNSTSRNLEIFNNLTVENITVNENLSANFYYAEAYFHTHVGITLTFVDDVWYNLTFNDSINLNGFSWDGDGNLTCSVPGLYQVNFVACGSGQNNHVYHAVVGLNGVTQVNISAHKKMAAGGDETDMSATGFIRLTDGDYVSLMIRDHGGSGTGLYIHSNLNLVRIGD